MSRARWLVGVAGTLALAVSFPSRSAPADYPPGVRRAMACMVNVLRTVPGVSYSRSGVMPPAETPFVEYRWRGSKITFLAVGNGDNPDLAHVAFQVILNGLTTPGKEPDDMETGRITTLWYRRCGVNTSVLFE